MLLLSLGSGVATALGDALYFKIKVGAPIMTVLATNFSLDAGLRPATLVTLVCLGVTLAAAARSLDGPEEDPGPSGVEGMNPQPATGASHGTIALPPWLSGVELCISGLRFGPSTRRETSGPLATG